MVRMLSKDAGHNLQDVQRSETGSCFPDLEAAAGPFPYYFAGHCDGMCVCGSIVPSARVILACSNDNTLQCFGTWEHFRNFHVVE